MISYLKRQGLYEISIGASEESYEEPSDWLNDCDRAIGAICPAISPSIQYLINSVYYAKISRQDWIEFWERTMRILLATWRVPLAPQ